MGSNKCLYIGKVIIYEDAVIAVSFTNNQVIPRAACIKSQQVIFSTIVHTWTGSHRGNRLRYFLTEDAQQQQYKLYFNPQVLLWMVEEMPVNV